MSISRNVVLPAWLFLALAAGVRAEDWPQWLGPKRDAVWREEGILDNFPAGGPMLRWAVPIGAGYAGPAVAGGRVFVTDRRLIPGAANPGNPFERGAVPGTERVLCLDEASGKILWQDEYPCNYTISYAAGPRATPAVADGKLYTLGAEGHLRCYEAESGKLLWSTRLGADDGSTTPVWGFAASPLVDGDKLITLGTADAVAIAFNRHTGQVLWKALQAREPGYSPPVIIKAGGRRQLIIFHPESLNSLDPETGQVYWSQPFESRAGLSVAMPRQLGDMLFVTSFYNGSMVMRLDPAAPSANVLWKRGGRSERNTEALHSIIPTPFLLDGHVYGVCSYGQLRCLEAATGRRLWETFAATSGDAGPVRWANTFLIRHRDRFFLANERGELIIARLTPQGYTEIGRASLIEPTNADPQRKVVWSHPAFANRSVYLRNDREIRCYSLAAPQ